MNATLIQSATEKQREQLTADLRTIRDHANGGLLALLTLNEEYYATTTPIPEQMVETKEHLRQIQTAHSRISEIVGELGLTVAKPHRMPEVDINQLDTPDTRALLAALENAQEIAERVDAARGRTVGNDFPLQPAESAGTDLAESIALLVLRLRNEVGGAYSPHE